jgi:cell division protein FtsI/penicillin-binding protein 2
MHLSTTSLEGRTSYSVPKQELNLTKCFTTLKVKRTVHESVCDHALRRLRHDLASHVFKNDVKVPVSTENRTSGNWVALAMPGAVSSRLGLMTRIASLMTLYDIVDDVLLSRSATCSMFSDHFTLDLAEALPITRDQQQSSKIHTGMKAHQRTHNTIVVGLVKPIVQDLTLIDQSEGIEVLKSWRRHYHKPATPTPISGITTSPDAYKHAYTHTFSSKPWMVTLRYALGLHLEESELVAIEPTIEAAMQSVALTRDYWAWPKDSCSADNNKRLKNAVAISMVEKQCSEAQAMVLVKKAAITAESKFLEHKLKVLEAIGKAHSEVTMFLDAVEHFAAGNSLWCSTCPLYHDRR